MEDRQNQGDNRDQQASGQQGGGQQGSGMQQEQQDSSRQQGGMGQSGGQAGQAGQSGGMGQSSGQSGGSGQQQQFDSQGSGQSGGSGGMDSQFADQIREHMEVIDADGQHVGTVDSLDGDQIKLTKSDSGSGSSANEHRYLPLDQVQGVEDGRVRLNQRSGGAGGYGMEADR